MKLNEEKIYVTTVIQKVLSLLLKKMWRK